MIDVTVGYSVDASDLNPLVGATSTRVVCRARMDPVIDLGTLRAPLVHWGPRRVRCDPCWFWRVLEVAGVVIVGCWTERSRHSQDKMRTQLSFPPKPFRRTVRREKPFCAWRFNFKPSVPR